MRFFILITILALFSCSAKRLPPTELKDVVYGNRLVKKGCSISVPDNYIFLLKKNEIKNVIARFRGPSVTGIVEILNYALPMENEKLAGYYADRVLEKAKNRTISKVSSKRDIFIISAESDDGKREMKTALWLIKKRKLFILQLLADKGFFEKNTDLLPVILSGWKDEEVFLNMRVKKGFPIFRSENGHFIWYNDLKKGDGFRIYDRKRKIRVMISKNANKDRRGTIVDYNSNGKMNFEVRELGTEKVTYRIFEIPYRDFKISFKIGNDGKTENLNSYFESFFNDLFSTLLWD